MKNIGLESGAKAGQGDFLTYSVGLALALLLSLLSFACIMLKLRPPGGLLAAITVAAVAQVLVHLHYFLHMSHASIPKWNIIVFAFAMVVIAILISGSLWIMAEANQHMMPAMNLKALP